MKDESFMKLPRRPKRVFLKINGCSTRIIITDYRQCYGRKRKKDIEIVKKEILALLKAKTWS